MRRAVLLALVLFGACGGDGQEPADEPPTPASSVESSATPSPSPSSTILTESDLSDGERVWCADNLKAVVKAAETLGLTPVDSVDPDDPIYKGGPTGSDNAFLLKDYKADFKAANAGIKVYNSVDDSVIYR